jgi:hypothetical protein
MTPRLTLRAATCLAALAASLSSAPAQADTWQTVAVIPSTQVQISIDPTTVARPSNVVASWLQNLLASHPKDNLTRAWFLFDFPAPVTTAESYVYLSYKRREIIDCTARASATESYLAYSDPRGTGRVIYTWTGPNAVLPRLVPASPGSVTALMIDAACAPPAEPAPPPPAAAAPDNGASAVPPVNHTEPADAPPGAPAPAAGMAPRNDTQALP